MSDIERLTSNLLNLGIEGIVEIPQCGLYAKSPEALEVLFALLEGLGYEVKDCGKDERGRRPSRHIQEQQGWYLWHASLKDDVSVQKGKCGSCGSYIDLRGIRTHKHACEVCGAYTYLDFERGSKIQFSFAEDMSHERGMFSDIGMIIYDHDESIGSLLLHPEPVDEKGFGKLNREKAKKVLEANSKQYRRIPARLPKGVRKHIRRLKAEGRHSEAEDIKLKFGRRYGVPVIAIPYDPCSGRVGVISTTSLSGGRSNHRIVKLYKDKEYGEWDSLPLPESYSIYEAWHWMPATSDDGLLHEKIIKSAGMVTDCGYYYQNGRREFYEIHLLRMRLYVENFTNIPIETWDEFILGADKSGPGMIKEMAAFCQGVTSREAVYENKPNMGNLING